MERNAFRMAGVLFLTLLAFSLCNEVQAQVSRRNQDPMAKYRYGAKKKKGGLAAWRAGSQNKLAGGIKNLLAAPMELPAAMGRTYQKQGAIAALLNGTFSGLSQVVRRAGAGLTDIATFPTKYPNNSYANSMKPKGPIQVLNGSRKRSYSYRRR